MFPLQSVVLSRPTMIAFLQYIEASGGALDALQAADEAIRQWLARRIANPATHTGAEAVVDEPTEAEADFDTDAGAPRAAPLAQGYQWKCLYLPEGTRLKLWRYPEHGCAEVIDGQLMYEGESTSPNRFTFACSGTVRNAWVEVVLLMPGDTRWLTAKVRRWRMFAEARPPGKPGAPLPPEGDVQPWDWRHLPPGERLYEPVPPPRCR